MTGESLRALVPGSAVGDLERRLLQRWGEPHRHYHDRRHLAECLAAVRWLGGGRLELLAAWFHDAVYDGVAGDDERRSAELARTELAALGLPDAEVAEVVRLVLLTITHRAAPDDPAGQRLCDADLSILGSDPGRYRQSVADIRQEYRRFDDARWRRGRLAVVDTFLGTDPLFHTDRGRRRWQARAYRNLAAERATLS